MSLPLPARAAVAILGFTVLLTVLAGCSDSQDAEPGAAPATSGSQSAQAVDTLVSTGLSQLESGEAAAAEITFGNVLALDPDNVFAHYNLGVIAQGRGEDDQARRSYEQSLAVDDSFGPALYNLGILTESNDLDAAVTLYRRATEADPEFGPAFMRLGFALVHLGQEEEGATKLQRGIELDPSLKDVEAPSYD
ncbi:MAG: tetratricopeptide repeat protein [Nocardioides sp.]